LQLEPANQFLRRRDVALFDESTLTDMIQAVLYRQTIYSHTQRD